MDPKEYNIFQICIKPENFFPNEVEKLGIIWTMISLPTSLLKWHEGVMGNNWDEVSIDQVIMKSLVCQLRVSLDHFILSSWSPSVGFVLLETGLEVF